MNFLNLLAHITPPDLGVLAFIMVLAPFWDWLKSKLRKGRKGACCKTEQTHDDERTTKT